MLWEKKKHIKIWIAMSHPDSPAMVIHIHVLSQVCQVGIGSKFVHKCHTPTQILECLSCLNFRHKRNPTTRELVQDWQSLIYYTEVKYWHYRNIRRKRIEALWRFLGIPQENLESVDGGERYLDSSSNLSLEMNFLR